jgi:hypothetical protein
MLLRLAAALGVLLGGGLLLAFLTLLGHGPFAHPDARHLRAMKDRTAMPKQVERWRIGDFEALPHAVPLAEYSKLERRAVSMEGWIQRMVRAPDGDTHLEVTQTRREFEGPDTLYVTAEVTPQFSSGSRTWSYDALAGAFRPRRGTVSPWPGGPVRVRLTGWLLYDWQYDNVPSPWQRAHAAMRSTGWEIHPVTSIELWDDARAGWKELTR